MALDQPGFNIYVSVIYIFGGLVLSFLYNLTPTFQKAGRITIRVAIGFTLGSVLCVQLLRQFAESTTTNWEKYLISSIAGVCLAIFYAFFSYFAYATLGLYFGLIISSLFWVDIPALGLSEGAQLMSDTLAVIFAVTMLLASRSDNKLWEMVLTFTHAVCGSQILLQGMGCFIDGQGPHGNNLPVIQPYWVFFGTKVESLECKPAAVAGSDRGLAFGLVIGLAFVFSIIQTITFSIKANGLLKNWTSPRRTDEESPLLNGHRVFNDSVADLDEENPDEGALEFTAPILGFNNQGSSSFMNATLQALRVVHPLVEGLRPLSDISEIGLALRPKALSSSIVALRERMDTKKFPLKKQSDAHEFYSYLLEEIQNFGGADLITRCFQSHIDCKAQCSGCGRVSNLKTESVLDVTVGIQGMNTLSRALSKEFGDETIKNYSCEHCGAERIQARKTTSLIPPANPEFHLAVTLKWFIDDTKLGQNFEVPLVIEVGGTTWSLVSVIYHQGSTPKEGHYYAWSRWEGQWYECNDDSVNLVSFSSSGRYEVYDIPYMLVYRRRSSEEERENDIESGVISYRHLRKGDKRLRKIKKQKEINPFEMDSYDPRMRERAKPSPRIYYRICLVFTILFGFWWIVWLVFWGHNVSSFLGGLEYTIYTIAEIINYFLNGIYFFNFWKPVNRRWRSLNNLKPDFNLAKPPTVNTLICHYQEDINDTRRTFAACLEMITAQKLKLNIFICDDGYFEKGKDGKLQVSAKGSEMTQMMKEELLRYYTSKGIDDVRVVTNHTLKNTENGRLVRLDCATASHRLEFKAYRESNGKLLMGPRCFLIAREKPPNHHYKAGNLNNCIYNEKLRGEFVMLLDNDMAPLDKFLMRTIPWFYRQTRRGKYRLDEGVAFLQCPQDFENVDQEDFLGNRNSIFFKAIQKGRDGHDSCAFAGTNAIFLIKALHSIGGVPYGTVTEDAWAGILLHQKGYRSYYIEEKLAIGLAPETSAQSMIQRMRWVKGSVQILLLPAHFHDDTAGEQIKFVDGYKVPKIEIPPKMRIREDRKFVTKVFRTMFRLDTMLYPFSAITAIMYMLVTILFVFSNQTPIGFSDPSSPGLNGYTSFVYTFLPYFLFRFLAGLFSVSGTVSANDVWRAQEIWFSYAFCSLVGVIDAFYQKCRGKALFSWGNTAAVSNTVWLEWFNIGAVSLMLIGMIYRTLMIFRGTQCFTDFAALMFTGSIMMQLWPMVSISLWQRIYNRYPDENGEVKRAGRIEIPNYLLFTITVVLGILISEAGSSNLCTAGASIA